MCVRSGAVTTALSIIAIVLSVGALVVAGLTARYNQRSADASEASAISSDRSADAAKDAAESARIVAKSELGRDHRELSPDLSAARFKSIRNDRTGASDWFYLFTVPKTYRLQGDLMFGGSRSPISPAGPVLEAGVEHRVFLCTTRNQPVPDVLELRFFPPAADDPGETWTCSCSEPVATDLTGRGHWVARVNVKQPPRPSMRVIGG